jgi:Sugar (and other) transporter
METYQRGTEVMTTTTTTTTVPMQHDNHISSTSNTILSSPPDGLLMKTTSTVTTTTNDENIRTNTNTDPHNPTTHTTGGSDGCVGSSTSRYIMDNNNNSIDDSKMDAWQTIASVAGNVLEWYDFSVFGYLSDILGEVFFPPNQKGGTESTTTESYVVFGLAFLMRPIGGAMLGYIGDKYGRKKALVFSIFLMAFPTFIMGTLPGYNTVGGWAIFFLVIVRLLQGLSVGGQLVSSLVFMLENHNPAHWGLYGSFAMSAAIL